ncbi:energy transducer TonB [candidate division WOR-3 bacterium]|nr:energy transducer TonB [candidate division WOR-3 bacterium]
MKRRTFDTKGPMRIGIAMALLLHVVAFMTIPEPEIPVYKPLDSRERETIQANINVGIDFRTVEDVVRIIENQNVIEIPKQDGGEIIISDKGDTLLGNITDSVFLIDTVSLIPEDTSDTGSEYVMSYEIPPRPVKLQEPAYPSAALNGGLEGTVVLMLYVDIDGTVTKAEVINSTNPLFDQSAVDAGLKCVFKPAESAGRPVRVKLVFPVNFKLNG